MDRAQRQQLQLAPMLTSPGACAPPAHCHALQWYLVLEGVLHEPRGHTGTRPSTTAEVQPLHEQHAPLSCAQCTQGVTRPARGGWGALGAHQPCWTRLALGAALDMMQIFDQPGRAKARTLTCEALDRIPAARRFTAWLWHTHTGNCIVSHCFFCVHPGSRCRSNCLFDSLEPLLRLAQR